LIWLLILVVMGTKIFIEAAMDESIFAQAESIPFQVLPSVHIVGYLGALATIIWTWPNTVRREEYESE